MRANNANHNNRRFSKTSYVTSFQAPNSELNGTQHKLASFSLKDADWPGRFLPDLLQRFSMGLQELTLKNLSNSSAGSWEAQTTLWLYSKCCFIWDWQHRKCNVALVITSQLNRDFEQLHFFAPPFSYLASAMHSDSHEGTYSWDYQSKSESFLAPGCATVLARRKLEFASIFGGDAESTKLQCSELFYGSALHRIWPQSLHEQTPQLSPSLKMSCVINCRPFFPPLNKPK